VTILAVLDGTRVIFSLACCNVNFKVSENPHSADMRYSAVSLVADHQGATRHFHGW